MPPRRRLTPFLLIAGLVAAVAAIVVVPRPEDRAAGPEPLVAQEGSPGAPRTVVNGVLTVGADLPYPPFVHEEPDGGVAGFDADLIREIAGRLGLEARIVDADFEDVFDALAAHELDVAVGAIPVTPEIESVVDLSEPYFTVRQALVVNVQASADVTGSGDLGLGDRVAVVAGSRGHEWASAQLEPRGVTLVPFEQMGQAALALDAGAVDAMVGEELPALAEATARENFGVVDSVATGEAYAIGVDPGNPDLLTAVNDALGALLADGGYDRLFDRHAASLPPGGRITLAAR